jgi:hypothetical protein
LRVSRPLALSFALTIEAKANQFKGRPTKTEQEDNAHFDEAESMGKIHVETLLIRDATAPNYSLL